MIVNTNIVSKTTLRNNPEDVYITDYLHPPPPRVIELRALNCRQLRDRLKDQRMPTSGAKEQLIARLMQPSIEDDHYTNDTFHEIDSMMSSQPVTPSNSPLKSVAPSKSDNTTGPKSNDSSAVAEELKSPTPVAAAVEAAKLQLAAPVAAAVEAVELKSPLKSVPTTEQICFEELKSPTSLNDSPAVTELKSSGPLAAVDAAATQFKSDVSPPPVPNPAAVAAAEFKGTVIPSTVPFMPTSEHVENSGAAVIIPNASSLKRSEPEADEGPSPASSGAKKMKPSPPTTTEVPSPTVHALQKCDFATYHDSANQRTSCGEGELCIDIRLLATEVGLPPEVVAAFFRDQNNKQGFPGPCITGIREARDIFPGIMVGYRRLPDDPDKVMGDGGTKQWRPVYILICSLRGMTIEQFHQDITNRCNAYANSHIGEGHGNFMYPMKFIKGDLDKNPIFWNDLLNTKSVMHFLKQYYKHNTLQDIMADESVMIRFFGSVDVGRQRLNSKKAKWDKL